MSKASCTVAFSANVAITGEELALFIYILLSALYLKTLTRVTVIQREIDLSINMDLEGELQLRLTFASVLEYSEVVYHSVLRVALCTVCIRLHRVALLLGWQYWHRKPLCN